MSRYWSKNLNNSPVSGYEPAPQYVSERGNRPEPIEFEYAANRQQRRMAERAIRQYAASDQAHEKGSPERRLGNGELPIADMRHEIVDSIANNQVTIITAETGAGKSTQVMQYILDDLDRDVALTQPRRIAARNIAQRVENEVASAWPEQEGLIGYHTAEVNTVTNATRGVVCTDGLRYVKQLHDNGALTREVLCIDEVHEWNTNIEMLVAWTRELLKGNPEMRVVLMSATMDAEEIANFYADVTDTIPPIIKVPGRTYPVDKYEMPSSTVVDVVTSDMAKGKNILCFLPGKREIKDAIKQTRRQLQKEGGDVLPEMLALHSRMSEKEQDRAFKSYPNNKIVFATDVAQTSLTIDDIDMVVDSGLVRENQIDDEGTESLSLLEISQDSSDQRAGRAGRVKEGTYVLARLNKNVDFMPYINREKHSVPEIYRTDVDRNTLHFAAVGLDIANIKLLHSLKKEPLERSKRSLRLLGALDENDDITAMGRRMEKLSLHPMFARMVVESEQYSVATRAQVMAIAAACDTGGLRYYGPETEKRWKPLVQEVDSDAIAELELFMAARDMSPWEQQQHDLDVNNVNRATEQYEKMMRNALLGVDVISAPTQQERENIKRCIYAGMIDHIYEYAGSDEYVRINGESKTRREISNRSVVKGRPALVAATPYRVEFYQSGDKVERHIVENVTKVNAPHVLAEVALHLCSWETDAQTLRGGQLMDVQALNFRGVATGVTREVSAEVNEQSHEFMVEHVMSNPGSALRDLYAVEAEIKQLRKLSPDAPKSIHNTIRSIVKEAVSQGGLDESYIDHLIRQHNISLYSYISQDKIDEIYNNSPLSVSSYGYDFKLSYEAGVPLVKKYDSEAVTTFPGEVQLEDGRIVKFIGAHGKHLTVDMLKRQ